MSKKTNYFARRFGWIKNINPEKGLAPIIIYGAIALSTVIAGWFGIKTQIGGVVANTLAAMLIWVAWVILAICKVLCLFATDVFDTSLGWLSKSITRDPAFINAWTTVRDFSNMFIVLGFVIIGIVVALRLKEYEAKKLLVPLIVVAFLINFSGLFCGLIIDASNIASSSLLKTGGIGTAGSGMGHSYFTILQGYEVSAINEEYKATEDPNQDIKALSATIFVAIIYLAAAFVFFYMAILFIARFAVLGFFFILSPLAFVCKAFPFPAAQKIWNDWWQNFLKWAFIGVGGCLALWVSKSVMSTATGGHGMTLQSMSVILIFLVVGFKIMTKSSAVGASAVVGMVAGVAGFAVGVATKGIGIAAQLSGRTSIGQRSQEWAKNTKARAEETLGLAPVGHTAQQKAARTAESRKQVDALRTSSNPNDKARFDALVKNGKGSLGAAAIASANEHGELGKIINPNNTPDGLNETGARAAYATQFGHEWSDFTKKDPRLKKFDEKAVDEKLSAGSAPTVRVRGVTPPATQRIAPAAWQRGAAKEQLIAEAWQKMNIGDIRKLDEGALKDSGFIENTPINKIEKAAQEMSAAQVNAIKSHTDSLRLQAAAANPTSGTSPNLKKYNEILKKLAAIRRL